ncbi:MAG: hypothetical protein HC855_13865 [Rhizobiales bacterium]|nr:hypothetical protein [Hyphomicrobiales bacterium]
MSKYEPLGRHLRQQRFESVPMTFKEIERVLGFNLPASKRYPAWWSNNPSNNVMTYQWLEAGYETSAVDPHTEKLVFRRRSGATSAKMPSGSTPSPPSASQTRKSIFGCMKGKFSLAKGFDPTSPMELDEDWDIQYKAKK